MKKIIPRTVIVSLMSLFFATSLSLHALITAETARYFNGPTVSLVGDTSATVSLSDMVLSDITADELKELFFEYYETNQVCIMIYPTPEHCLPKKTVKGATTAVLTGLKSNTSYTVVYKKDNTIRCITTPCPENGFTSLAVTFVTKEIPTSQGTITRTLAFGSRGSEVVELQKILIRLSLLRTQATGYFGVATRSAVRTFQKNNNIAQVGQVGPITRTALNSLVPGVLSSQAETFEGVISAYSTSCFADGICSVTVDGKKVITTIGWSQKVVGELRGVPSIGDLESKIGKRAKVYALKTEDGYTLYGSSDYYVEVLP